MRARFLAMLALPLSMLIAHSGLLRAQDQQTATLTVTQRAKHALAVQSFREQRYAAAYARIAELADAGHVASAQLALVMFRNGALLFGSDWYASPDQQRRWNALVINSARGRIDIVEYERGD